MDMDGRWLNLYRWLVMALGIGFLVLTGDIQGPESLLLVALYTALAVGVEATRIELDSGSVSLSSGIVLAALVTAGVPTALIVVAASYLLADILRQQFSATTVFNAGQAALAVLLAATFYRAAGGTIGGGSVAFLLPQASFLIAYYLANHTLVGLALLLGKGSVSLADYKLLALWDLLATLLALPVGMYLAEVYFNLDRRALSVAAILLLILSYVLYLYAQVRHSHTEIMKVYRATRKIATSIDLNTTLNLILEQAQNLTAYNEGLVYLVDGQTLMPAAHLGPIPDKIRYREVAFGEGIAGKAALQRMVVVFPEENRSPMSKYAVREYELALPLTVGERLVGVLALKRRRLAFKQREVQYLSIIAGQAAAALENARLYSEVAALARLDGLTGIFNRRALLEILTGELARCSRYDLRLSVLMVDLDNFKKVNDVYGHMAGDAILKKITACIQAHVRNVDVVGRYGGDEIVIILPETGPAEAYAVGERICAAVRNLMAGEVLPVTTSIGIAGYPQHGDNAEGLLAAADQAMYQAKHLGGDCVLSFSQLLLPEIQSAGGLDKKS
jgi:two-component system cell cycle response regulator